jgi:uncharacterized coiled-coil DUF342 family protein
MEEMARELANVEQGIDQLKTERSQMAGVNAEVVEQLKAMRELARHNAELIEDLKTMQAQTAHEISNLAEQIKEHQVLLATTAKQLKESQEQLGRLLASEPRQRQRAASSLPPTPVTFLARKPAPKSPAATIGVQTQNPSHLQPKQE